MPPFMKLLVLHLGLVVKPYSHFVDFDTVNLRECNLASCKSIQIGS